MMVVEYKKTTITMPKREILINPLSERFPEQGPWIPSCHRRIAREKALEIDKMLKEFEKLKILPQPQSKIRTENTPTPLHE